MLVYSNFHYSPAKVNPGDPVGDKHGEYLPIGKYIHVSDEYDYR